MDGMSEHLLTINQETDLYTYRNKAQNNNALGYRYVIIRSEFVRRVQTFAAVCSCDYCVFLIKAEIDFVAKSIPVVATV